ncbi:aldehyde dehydrogenase family protein [Sphingobacterium alkalisoli]|uniref:Aldehyde dehydrogenase family protein n=1 Tax=Sphingobacterium alkalisoli TaxID=1874115 RepID=A0A4U0H631_9SPHI|nr:aldehyde dehydrogenase family protein [Sphingobacterium alkalisoli]TJY67096.1 aldehyde dehydrogenase family protein [Sphingobacterium alkalisoli]GGH12247.1 aldehyde dehydrogenase [Sphingobacterium alkalisoli]
MEVKKYKYYAGGVWRDAENGRTFDDLEPYSGKVFAKIAAASKKDMQIAIDAAAKAYPAWAATTPAQRSELLFKAAAIIKRRRSEMAEILAKETGSTISFATFQQDLLAQSLELGAGWAYENKGEVLQTNVPGSFSIGVRRPLGVVASFTPWNGASILSWRTVISPIIAGNTVVVKPSEYAPISAGLMIAEIAEEAGFPPGVINVVTHAPGEAGELSDAIFEDSNVRVINLIGGIKTAKYLGERAGKTLKRTVFELGGYNPMIILNDVNVDDAVKAATFGSFFHQGQICMNTRKIIIQRKIYDEFLEKFIARTNALPFGDPENPTTIIGPLINQAAVDTVSERIKDAVSKGAKVQAGGFNEGLVYHPTILTDVPYDAIASNEETFGPLVIVEAVDTVEEAIAIANRTDYGLVSSIFTNDTYKGFELAPRILHGVVNVNSPTVNEETHAPMGGVKNSGWGRTGPHSLEDFTEMIWINSRSTPQQYPF